MSEKPQPPHHSLTISDPAHDAVVPWRPPFEHEWHGGCPHHVFERREEDGDVFYHWSFEIVKAGLHPDIFSIYWSRRPFDRLRVRVRNQASCALRLMVAVHDVRGRWAFHPPKELPKRARWIDLDFPLSAFQGHGQDPPAIQPIKHVMVRVQDPPMGERASLDLGAVIGLEPEAPRELAVSQTPVVAGSELDWIARTGNSHPAQWLTLRSGDRCLSAFSDADNPYYRVPAGLRGGQYDVELWEEGRLGGRWVGLHVVEEALPFLPRGNAGFSTGYMTYNPKPEMLRAFAELGVGSFSLTTTLDEHIFDLAPPTVWGPREDEDFALTEALILSVFEAVPHAQLTLRIYCGSTAAWEQDHQGELCQGEDPDGTVQPQSMVFVDSRQRRRVPSLASTLLRARWKTRLEAYLDWLRRAPWGHRVVGLILCSGGSEEWFHWYDEEKPKRWADVSGATRRAWHRWRGEDADLPSRAQRAQTSFHFMRDPLKERRVLDYFRFQAETVVEAIAALATQVKEQTEGVSVGVFYGYTNIFTGENRHLHGGHHALSKLLNLETIDFVCAPTGYGHREPGDGFSYSMIPAGSLRLHGKLAVVENDLRTHRVRVPEEIEDVDELARLWGFTPTVEGAIAVQRRELGRCLAEGGHYWWFDLYPYGLYDDPRLLEEFAAHLKIAEHSRATPDPVDVSIAVFVDEESIRHESTDGIVHWHCVESAWPEFARCGAPCEVFLLDDLPQVGERKLYVFLNAWAPSEEVRREVKRLRDESEATLLFCGPAGLYRKGRVDPRGPQDFVGLETITVLEDVVSTQTSIEAEGLAFGESPLRYGPDVMPAPWVVPQTQEAYECLGRDGRGEPRLVRSRRSNGGKTYFTAAPSPPAPFLAMVAEESGIHLYAREGDPLHVAAGVLTIHARTSGEKTVRLPKEGVCTDAFTKERIPKTGLDHSFRMERGETRILLVTSGDSFRGRIQS